MGDSRAGWRAAGTGSRQIALSPSLRVLHQRVLRHFLDSGGAPDRTWLEGLARRLGLDPDAARTELAAADLLHLDRHGRVDVAYPFSGLDRGHRVQLVGGPAVWAMCAIDALGIPQLARRDASITATDQATGKPVRVDVRAGAWRWLPASTVVLVAKAGSGGTSAECACGHVNFYAGAKDAGAYLDHHPDVTGRIVGQHDAIELAGAVFGALLDEANPD
jgi:alkylmercury lyase-like protein